MQVSSDSRSGPFDLDEPSQAVLVEKIDNQSDQTTGREQEPPAKIDRAKNAELKGRGLQARDVLHIDSSNFKPVITGPEIGEVHLALVTGRNPFGVYAVEFVFIPQSVFAPKAQSDKLNSYIIAGRVEFDRRNVGRARFRQGPLFSRNTNVTDKDWRCARRLTHRSRIDPHDPIDRRNPDIASPVF